MASIQPPDERSFGYLLRRYRLAALLTQEQLAERAHLSYRTISDLERGAKHTPRRDTVLLLADALQLSPQERATLIAAIQPRDQQPEAGVLPHEQEPSQASVRAFLIADVRGYTAFTNEHGDEAAARLADRFAFLTKAGVEQRDGEVLELRGDEALAVFESPRQALNASLELQDRFRRETEGHPDLPLRVGIGIDVGEAIPVRGGYRGGALNLAARLCSIAGPGDVFCSETAIGLVRKTAGIAFVDRGEVTLKGLSSPVRVIQIAPEGQLPEELPPLQPILVTHPNNLPDEPTPFIGREQEIDQIAASFRDLHTRLVTLIGPGGTGKTRLALQVGNTLLHSFSDGVFFVSLASLSDPVLVPSAIAEVVGAKEGAGRDLLESLIGHLKDKQLLLVLDNFEHLLSACDDIATLLDACRKLRVLVTSRIPLHLSREHVHAVPPLSVPDLKHPSDLATLSRYEAVALFVERARAARDTFALTDANARAVAEICSRLDGLPLAIELAAARIKLFPPQALLQRLSSSLKLLTGGAKDRPSRQQTLRNTIEWSYSLLSPEEQTLFARLSVFAGGCTLEAAERVCQLEGESSIEIVEGVISLLDQSLLRELGEEEPAFLMLETIREYAAGRLESGDQAEAARERHAIYYLKLAEEAEPELTGAHQVRWLDRLEGEHDNLRAALGWLLAGERAEEGLRLAGSLWRFWSAHGHVSEGRRWLEGALAVPEGGSSAVRAKALNGAGNIASNQGDYERATTLIDESLTLRRELGDTSGIAGSLSNLGIVAWAQGKYQLATSLWDESLMAARDVGDPRLIAVSLGNLGDVAGAQGEYVRATALFDESLTILRELGDTAGIAHTLSDLGISAGAQGSYERATTLLREGQALFRQVGNSGGSAFSLVYLGIVARDQGDLEQAAELCRESLVMARMLGDSRTVAISLNGLGVVASDKRNHQQATALCQESLALARKLGATDAIERSLNILGMVSLAQRDFEQATTLCRESLMLARERGENHQAVESLEHLGQVAAAGRQQERAVRLWAAVESWREAKGVPRPPVEQQHHELVATDARQQLDEATWTTAWEEGRAMSLEQAIQYALDEGAT